MGEPQKFYIIAIDFDGTLCRGGFPDISKGDLIQSTLDKMLGKIKTSKYPVEFILWTCRAGIKLDDARMFCEQNNIPISYYNEQHPSTFVWMEDADVTRKIFAHEYWDDRSVRIEDPDKENK